jgi:YfiH family protein
MNFITCKQTHSANVHVVTNDDIGQEIPDCDGLISNISNVEISIKTADCVPISIIDPIKNVIGVVHAGWRGTEKEIVKKAINLMISKFGSKVKDTKIKIGPAIDKDNFLVRSDVKNKFDKYQDLFENVGDNQWKFDLVGVNIKQLLSLGILEENIENSNISTFNDKNYPSYRRDGKSVGFKTSMVLK